MSNPETAPRLVYLSGEMVPEAEAKISIFDSAIMLGDSVTESTRTFCHEPFRLDEHIARLFRSMKVARIDSRTFAQRTDANHSERTRCKPLSDG